MSNTQNSPLLITYPLYVTVALDEGLDKPLDYGVLEEMIPDVAIGARVKVPLRSSLRDALIIEIKKSTECKSCQPIKKIVSKSLITPSLFKLADWMSSYYLCPLRRVLQLFLPLSIRANKKQQELSLIKLLSSKEKLAHFAAKIRSKKQAQARVCDYLLKAEGKIFVSELLKAIKVSPASLMSLAKEGLIQIEKEIKETNFEHEHFLSKPKILNGEQQQAFDQIKQKLTQGSFSTHLLHGITGSGKTEVYLKLIEEVSSLGYGALMMVPEVALTTQMIEKFRSRLKIPIGVYHYKMSPKEKKDLWKKLSDGEILVVIGARSSIFLPFKNLKLTIVDEEHESSYKQQEKAPCYQARNVALMRAYIEQSCIVLGSATPSFESYFNALKGKYQLHELKERATELPLPKITLIDMKKEREKNKKTGIFSDTLLDKIAKKIEAREQVLLFLNRRGFYTTLLCQECDEVKKCPSCDVSLTYHMKERSLRCHLCGYFLKNTPQSCSHCKSSKTLLFRGYGTEQVELQLKKIFPSITTLRMDADTTTKKGSHELIYNSFKHQKADVLIGTQMIAKGFHFPSVTLVGVINADTSMNHCDYRATEALFQLLVQVSGRAGRELLPGEVLIQTHHSSHPLFTHLLGHDYKGFYQQEAESRAFFNYPPFTRLAKITFTSKDEALNLLELQRFHTLLQKNLPKEASLLPPIPDPLSKAQNLFRHHFILKHKNLFKISPLIKNTLLSMTLNKKVNYIIEIDN